VDAFLAAARGGDFGALLALLDPDVVLRADTAVVARPRSPMGGSAEVRGARAVAQRFAGGGLAAEPALLDGAPGLVWAHQGRPRVAFNFTIRAGRITAIELIGDKDRLAAMAITAA
jgi:RNA polymerase sigma-70 factor (ECF subfamily)